MFCCSSDLVADQMKHVFNISSLYQYPRNSLFVQRLCSFLEMFLSHGLRELDQWQVQGVFTKETHEYLTRRDSGIAPQAASCCGLDLARLRGYVQQGQRFISGEHNLVLLMQLSWRACGAFVLAAPLLCPEQ